MSAPTIVRPMYLNEVSEETGIPIETLRHWRQHGTGPRSFKVGRRVAYDRAEVAAWMEARKNAPGARGKA